MPDREPPPTEVHGAPDTGRAPLRVLRLIARMNVGGPAFHVALLSAGLDARGGYRHWLATGREGAREGSLRHEATSRGVRLVEIPELGRELAGLFDLVALWRMWRLIRRVRPHIVHTHTAKAGALGRLAAWLARVPVRVHTFHGHTFHGYFSPRKTRVFLAIERFLARRTHAIVAVSRRVRDDLLALGVGTPARLVHVPLGLELARFATPSPHAGALRAELGLDARTPLVGIVARLVPIKRIDLFLAAACDVLAVHPAARFAIAGDGESRAALEARARELGVADRVAFLGFRSPVEHVLSDLDLVVLCSDNEGLPVALLEALASGRPVVSTDAGGARDLVAGYGAAGRIVPTGDGAALARAIADALSNLEAARRAAAHASPAVIARYSVARLVDDMDGLYRALWTRRRRG